MLVNNLLNADNWITVKFPHATQHVSRYTCIQHHEHFVMTISRVGWLPTGSGNYKHPDSKDPRIDID